MIEPVRKFGWALADEPPPSLCKHYLPQGAHRHAMSVLCWCKPELQGEPNLSPPYTVVYHQG